MEQSSEYTQARTQDIATLALKAQSLGIADGWREYLAGEMKAAGVSGQEVAREMERQKSTRKESK